MNKRLFAIVILAVLLLVAFSLSACQEETPVEEPTVHVCEFVKNGKAVEPTCVSRGYQNYKCSGCGKEVRKDFKDPSDKKHSYATVETVAPTCTTYGYTVQECKYCSDINYASLTNPVHTYGEGVIVEGKTYVDNNYVVGYTCKDCGIYKEVIEQLDHKCEAVNMTVVEPTAKTSGYTLHECACRRYSEKTDFVAPIGSEGLSFKAFINFNNGGVEEYVVKATADYVADTIVIPYDYMGSEVTEIGLAAFEYATAVKVIELTNNIKVIGDYAFNNCNALVKIVYEGTISQWKNLIANVDWAPTELTEGPVSVEEVDEFFYVECTDGRLYMDGSILLNNGEFIPSRYTSEK